MRYTWNTPDGQPPTPWPVPNSHATSVAEQDIAQARADYLADPSKRTADRLAAAYEHAARTHTGLATTAHGPDITAHLQTADRYKRRAHRMHDRALNL